MYCSKCGAQNRDDAKFCDSCGAPLKQPAGPQLKQQTGPLTVARSLIALGVAAFVIAGIVANQGPDNSTQSTAPSGQETPAVLESPAAPMPEETPSHGPGIGAATTALPRSWQGLSLGMTPSQLERVCDKFDLGPATAEKDLEGLDGLTDVELPVIKRCVPHGCESLKVYVCQDETNISGVFLHGRAISILVLTSAMNPLPCTGVCRGVKQTSTSDCGSDRKCQACRACWDKALEEQMDKSLKEADARISSFNQPLRIAAGQWWQAGHRGFLGHVARYAYSDRFIGYRPA
jgi:hypothetical protein